MSQLEWHQFPTGWIMTLLKLKDFKETFENYISYFKSEKNYTPLTLVPVDTPVLIPKKHKISGKDILRATTNEKLLFLDCQTHSTL